MLRYRCLLSACLAEDSGCLRPLSKSFCRQALRLALVRRVLVLYYVAASFWGLGRRAMRFLERNVMIWWVKVGILMRAQCEEMLNRNVQEQVDLSTSSKPDHVGVNCNSVLIASSTLS
jgi:hypothetical protein